MKGIKIKETYLLFLIVIGLISLAGYTTYALFTASTEIEDVVEFFTSLSTNNSIVEYEMVTVPVGETKIIELNVTNSYGSTLYYGAWYEMVSPSTINDDIEIGLYTDKNNTPGSGTITSGTSLSLLVGITNNTSSDVIINIGTAGSLTNSLGFADTRVLIPTGWTDALIVTDEVLAQYTSSRTDTVITERDYSWLSTSSISTSGKATLTLNPGTYKLEVWGAEGGYGYNNATTYAGGKGGYSYGTLTLTSQTTAHVYVGGQGTAGNTTSSIKTGGYNGGGNSGRYRAGSGGGASDIRLGTDSLYARVIVAGGGGGGAYYSNYYGGAGGGTSGVNGTGRSSSTTYWAGGGSSSSGGKAGGYSGYTGTAGSFGQGGAAHTSTTNNYGRSGGGGGGWFGGGGGGYRANSTTYYYGTSGGGGGSGYVYTSSTASQCPSGCLLNSSYYLTNAATVAGNTSFTDFSGSTVTGHSGNGAAKITGTEKVETQVQVTTYSIPRVLGLSSLNVTLGTTADLTSGVSVECAEGETGCSLVSTPNLDTSTLAKGTYTVYYTIKDANNKKYKYPRTLIVAESAALNTLSLLNLTNSIKTGTPDFSVVSPKIATYRAGCYTTTSKVTYASSSRHVMYASTYEIDPDTGLFTLVNPIEGVWSNVYTSLVGKYIGNNTSNGAYSETYYKDLKSLYRIGASYSDGTMDYDLYCNSYPDTFDISDTGIYAAEDDLGTSYYFRGRPENNYVKFGKYRSNEPVIYYGIYSVSTVRTYSTLAECQSEATNCQTFSKAGKDMYWRIVRINGDGTIRLVYDGIQAHDDYKYSENPDYDSVFRSIGNTTFNTEYGDEMDNAYIGYMYGTIGASSYATAHTNRNNSNVKSVIDTWYANNLNSYSTYISDGIYCNDRQIYKYGDVEGLGYANSETYYMPYYRVSNLAPSLKCVQQNDRFTRDDMIGGVTGNSALTYPVGMLTVDEGILAGYTTSTNNRGNYLGTSLSTLSPGYYPASNYIEMFVLSGTATDGIIYGNYRIKPVITLKADAITGGTGIKTNPFTVG